MKVVDYFIDLFFPPKCIFCGKLLKPDTRPLVCEKCMNEFSGDEMVCSKCGGKIYSISGMPSCPVCRISGRYYDAAISALEYSGNVKSAMHRYKLGYQNYIGENLASFPEKLLNDLNIGGNTVDYIVSVPCNSKQKIKRGFDPSTLIAVSLSKKLDIVYLKNEILRVKNTPPQSGLNFRQRQENIRGAYKIKDKEIIKGKNILLVDDVITTGATVIEISRLLRRAGAKYVLAVSVAKTVKKK